MYVLITYDVATSSVGGQRRLRRVAKACLDYGQRVQNSVFECMLPPDKLIVLKHRLESIVDPALDSLRYYQLGADDKWRSRVEHFGAKPTLDVDGPLIL